MLLLPTVGCCRKYDSKVYISRDEENIFDGGGGLPGVDVFFLR